MDLLGRDRIVYGIIDKRLLRAPELTLDKFVEISRAAEITKQGISVLDSNPSANNHAENVNKISKGKPNIKDFLKYVFFKKCRITLRIDL